MQVISKTGPSELATVYIARSASGHLVEFVESCQPPLDRSQKWVMIISTLFGCPVDCMICDAGSNFRGRLSYGELLFQVSHLVLERYPDGQIDSHTVKIQFARMGEPAFNDNVLRLLEDLPALFQFRRLVPSLSTIAPRGRERFFQELSRIKKTQYPADFQLQFSIHSTDTAQRDRLIPARKWDFEEIAKYGQDFFEPGGKKITLNFALSTQTVMDPTVLAKFFDPRIFLVKVTPVNPTLKAGIHGIESLIRPGESCEEALVGIRQAGFEVILSIGEWKENLIGSNCGQYIQAKDCIKGPGAALSLIKEDKGI
jgi:23S rRNA (adenine2503-C2)-methyltransferase